jgi:segregation and condensation protein A
MFEVKTAEFSGPLEKLLELIEAKKMDITTISLASVTADFLAHIQAIKAAFTQVQEESVAPPAEKNELARILADFLSVAAQLVLIKSKALIPELPVEQDEEESMQDLEARLKLYAEIKPVLSLVKERWSPFPIMYSRELLKDIPPVFYPPAKLTPHDLEKSLANLLSLLGTFFMEQEKVERQLITLEEKIEDMFEKVSQGVRKFSHFLTEKSKEESIVIFLALLHLLRDRIVRVEQEGLFGEMSIEKSREEA